MNLRDIFKRREPVKNLIYLDYAAATPLTASVRSVMEQFSHFFANPSAVHSQGVAAREIIEQCRTRLARCLKVRPEGVVFTGNGTESNNLAIFGTVRAHHKAGVAYDQMAVISTKLEHPSVARVLEELVESGVNVRYVDVNEEGQIDMRHFETLLDERVMLVTCAYVNSEIGVIQPIPKLARSLKKYTDTSEQQIVLHVDAAQVPYWLPCQFDGLGVDLLSLDAGKCGGPKGIGVLAKRHGVELVGVLLGGGQEHNLRAGTESVSLIAGATEAIVSAQDNYSEVSQQVGELRDYAFSQLEALTGAVVNGSKEERVANNINLSIPGLDTEFAVISLDEAGIAISTKSACSGSGGGASEVVMAISGDTERANSTLRISLGPDTTKAELDFLVEKIAAHLQKVGEATAKLTAA